jgi:hypothetical protein
MLRSLVRQQEDATRLLGENMRAEAQEQVKITNKKQWKAISELRYVLPCLCCDVIAAMLNGKIQNGRYAFFSNMAELTSHVVCPIKPGINHCSYVTAKFCTSSKRRAYQLVVFFLYVN